MSTDPDTVRDNSGSLRNHRQSQSSGGRASASEPGSVNSGSFSAISPEHPLFQRPRPPISPITTTTATPQSGAASSGSGSASTGTGRPRQSSLSLHAAATLNAAEQKDTITSLSPKERKSISIGAAGIGLAEADEITTLTSSFGFTDPNYGSSSTGKEGRVSSPLIAPSPRNTTVLGSSYGSRNGSINPYSPGSTSASMAPPPPPPFPSSPSPSLPKTPSQRRRSAIALNLMLADPTLPSPGELSCSDRRASISSSGMAPAWAYAQRTGSIAGSAGSPASAWAYRTCSMSRSGSVSRRGSLGASATGTSTGNGGGGGAAAAGIGNALHQRRMSMGDMHQEQEQEHERIVLRLFSRISDLEAEIAHLRLNSAQRHPRARHRDPSPNAAIDTPLDSEVDMSAEDTEIDTDSTSPVYTHTHPSSVRASASHPAHAPGINISTLTEQGQDRSPSQPITIPNPRSWPSNRNRAGSGSASALGMGAGMGLGRTPSTGGASGSASRPPAPVFAPHYLRSRSGSTGSVGSWGIPPGPGNRTSVSARRSASSSYSPPLPTGLGLAASTIPERPGEREEEGDGVGYRATAQDDTNFWTRSPTMTGSVPSQSSMPLQLGGRDEGVAYWQSEAGFLTRENQLLRRRNRELERIVARYEGRISGGSDASSDAVASARQQMSGQGQGQGQGAGRSRGTSISELQLGASPTRPLQPSSLSQVATPHEEDEDEGKRMDVD